MSVILDALAKARRDATGDRARNGLTDSRALEGGHHSREWGGKARGGLLILVVCGAVAATMVLCVAGFYLLAVKMGAIAPGWPVTAMVSPGGVPAAGAGAVVGQDGAIAAPPAEPPANGVAASGNNQFPVPAPVSVVAAHGNNGGAGLAALPPPDELPIWIQQSPAPPVGAVPGQPAQAAQAGTVGTMMASGTVPAIAAAPVAPAPEIKIGTILCDETGCTAAANGRTVRVGDVILDYTVMAVTPDRVTLQKAGEPPMVLHPRS